MSVAGWRKKAKESKRRKSLIVPVPTKELVPIAKRPVWNQTKHRAWQAVFAKIDTERQYK